MIVDPGNHWHKDDMADEPDIPGLTSPAYDEHDGAPAEPAKPVDPDNIPF